MTGREASPPGARRVGGLLWPGSGQGVRHPQLACPSKQPRRRQGAAAGVGRAGAGGDGGAGRQLDAPGRPRVVERPWLRDHGQCSGVELPGRRGRREEILGP